MSIKAKFTWSFLSIIVLVAGLTIFIVQGVGKSSDGFTSYREMAKDAVLAGRVQANMLMVRMNVKDFLQTKSQKDLDEFNMYYDKTTGFVNTALKEIQKPSRAPDVKKIAEDLTQYKEHFNNVVSYFKKRDEVVHNNLDVNGKKIEQLLTDVMQSAHHDKDLEASLETSQAIRTLLLARLYTTKFLLNNKTSEEKRAINEFENLKHKLKEVKDHIQNKQRIAKLEQAIKLINKYEHGLEKIVQIIKKRNNIINNKLNVIGPDIAKLSEDIKLSIKKDQDTIGPMVADENEEIKSVSITVGVIITLVILILSFVMIKNALIKPLSLLEELTKDLSEGDGDLTKRLTVNGKDEIATVSNYINLFIEKVQTTISSVKQTSHENASISHELSTTATGVGKNVENSVVIVNETTEQAKGIQSEISNAISDAQESKEDIMQANENLGTARDDIVSLTSKVQETAQTESELAQNMEELSREAN